MDKIFYESGFKRTLCGTKWATSLTGTFLGRIGCCNSGSFMSDPLLAPFFKSKSCQLCPGGQFNSIENDELFCKICPTGKSSPAGSVSCDACSSGRILVSISPLNCSICPIGKYQPVDSHLDSNIACLDCAAEKSSPPDSSFCLCSAGTYQNSDQCLPCSAGLVIEDDGQTVSLHDSIDDCKYCPAGKKFVSLSQCSICHAGHYQESNDVAGVLCTECPIGRYLVDAATDKKEHKNISNCQFCSSGKEFTSLTIACTICLAGHYQDKNNAASVVCKQCQVGQFIDDEGIDETKHLSASNCQNCPIGYEVKDTTQCQVCGYSKYQDQSNVANATCKACPLNSFITDNRKLSNAHTSLSDCINCTDGKFATNGARSCSKCDAGRQQNKFSCTDCSAGEFSAKGSACVNCPAGFYQDEFGKPFCLPCIRKQYFSLIICCFMFRVSHFAFSLHTQIRFNDGSPYISTFFFILVFSFKHSW